MTRHQMREYAFMLTFESIFNNDTPEEIIELAKESEAIEVSSDVKALYLGVQEKLEVLDTEISKHLKKWTINRISKVALSAMRVAVYEILFSNDIDTDIAISEAVKITQDFTVKEDVSFINGVLSSIAKERKGS